MHNSFSKPAQVPLDMEENHHLLQPLLLSFTSSSAASTNVSPSLDDHELNNIKVISSDWSIVVRLSLVIFIGSISIWATHEASKGFDISIVNECRDTVLGKRFQLLYESNDEATRILIKASKIVENFLYATEDQPKKLVSRVIFKLVAHNLRDNFIVTSSDNNEFVLNISSFILDSTNFDQVISSTVQKGMSHIWLWDGRGNTPKSLINGIVEYIASNLGDRSPAPISESKAETPRSATASCWKHDDSRTVAEFLGYCEWLRPGFISRLNQVMKDNWHDGNLDIALGMPVQYLCTTYKSLRYNISSV